MADPILLFGETHHHTSILWRTGFLAPDPVVYLEHGDDRTLLVSSMELGRAKKEARGVTVRDFKEFDFYQRNVSEPGAESAFARMIAALLAEKGIQRIRVEPDFPLGLARALELRDIALVADGPAFGDGMRQKRPEEVAAMREAQAAAQRAMARGRDILHEAEPRDGYLYWHGEPLTSAVLIGEIEVTLLKMGYSADTTIAAGGSGAADPHVADSGHLEAGMGVILDIFPQSKKSRYFGDMTRTYAVGEPSQTWLRMYEAVKLAHAAALGEVRAGANARDVHRAAAGVLYEAGFSAQVEGFRREGVPEMIHGTGHGVGLDIHEPPRVGDADLVLLEGDVITIEPGLYHPDHGGVRLEDMVVVRADGYENLNDFPMDWRP